MIDLLVEKLSSSRHDRASFRCGVPQLDHFLKELAGQHQRRNFSTAYVLVAAAAPASILGYCSLSFGALRLADPGEQERRRLPRHPVPAARMGRPAVDESQRGKGYGELMLQNAVKRCLAAREEIAWYALAVDGKDEVAARFYGNTDFFVHGSGTAVVPAPRRLNQRPPIFASTCRQAS